MSKAPRADTQLLREPVRDTEPVAALLQSVVPLSGPGSGVPFAPTCHSALVGSRLPALAHASCAWNHVMCAEGDHRRQAHGVDVVGAILAVGRTRRVVVDRRAELRRSARRQDRPRSLFPAGSFSAGSRSSWSDWVHATRLPRTCPSKPAHGPVRHALIPATTRSGTSAHFLLPAITGPHL